MAAHLPRSLPLPTAQVRTGSRSLLGTIGRLADPGIALGCLLTVHALWGLEASTPVILLGALAFSLSYPGDLPFLKQPRGVIRRITAAWAMVVALGLDASEHDPLQGLRVSTEGFARMARLIAGLGIATVLVQEGGYLGPGLGENLSAFLAAFEHPDRA